MRGRFWVLRFAGTMAENDGKMWEYVGTDGATHGPFPSSQMRAWHAHGFFSSEASAQIHVRLTNYPQFQHQVRRWHTREQEEGNLDADGGVR